MQCSVARPYFLGFAIIKEHNQNYLRAAAREVVRRRSLVLGRGSLVARRAPIGKILPVPKKEKGKSHN